MTLFLLELVKLRHQKRTWIGLVGLPIVPIVGTVALYLERRHPGGGPAEALPLFASVMKNGLLVPVVGLMGISAFLLPLASAMIGANMIAGEAETGTLKTVLVRPVRRGSLLAAKLATALLYVLACLALVFVVAMASGQIAFGMHDIITPFVSFTVGHTIWFTFIAYVLALVAMSCVVAFAVFFSTLTNSSLAASVGALVIVLVVELLLQFSFFAFLRPYVFTNYFFGWTDLFQRSVPWGTIVKGVIDCLAWTTGFALLAWWRFRRRDVLV
jgi:ABC-2 type transport system permease protein